jgi:NAD(P)-dependent dehydrogenase (short-subunit alcohol dehydrogenase family)
MASRGARWLLLLSRSGATSHEAREFVKSLEYQGVHVAAPRCDISDEEGLRKSLADCTERMPTIGGCIQATMVLDVSSNHFATSICFHLLTVD